MKKKLNTIFLVVIMSSLINVSAGDMDTIKQRMVDYFFTNLSYSDSTVATHLNNQNTDGSWSDIDYTDTSNSGWDGYTHLGRLQAMAYVYINPSSTYYESVTILAAISSGIDYWYSVNPVSDNWWINDIGKQLSLAPIVFFLEDDLTTTRKNLIINDMATDTGTWTGQNKIWFSQEIIWHGLLDNDATLTTYGVNELEETIAFTPYEGLQTDYTFFQHGKILYNGGYGAGFVQDSAQWANFLTGTTYALEQTKIELLSQYMLEGNAWMTFYNMKDYSTNGRGITTPHINSEEYADACELLAELDSTNASALTALKNHINGSATPPVTGNKYFKYSHYHSHIRSNYYISLKMDSGATIANESFGGANLKGHWLSHGVNFISLDGTEYYDIMPIWDWARLPGVTNPYFTDDSDYGQYTWDVNGVSDGNCGISAMELDYADTTARKAWFFFDDGMVALGSGITSTATQAVGTTVNQCYLEGNVTADGSVLNSGSHSLSSVDWVHHNGIGYIFPDGASIKLKNQSQSGSWYSVNTNQSSTTVTNDVFTLWFDHGTTPEDATYQYIVIPDMTASETSSYAGNSPLEIIANTTEIQAVRDNTNDLSQIIFYQPGSIRVHSNLTVICNAPGLVMVDESTSTPVVTMSSLSGVPVTAIVNLDYDSGTDRNFYLHLQAVERRDEYPLTVNANADAYMQGGSNGDTNYGTSSVLVVKKYESNDTYDRRSYVKFKIPSFNQVQSAKIRLRCSGLWNGSSVVTAYGTSSSWTETAITYNNAPALGDKISQAIFSETGAWFELDVTDYIQSNNSGGDVSFCIYSDDGNGVVFNSRETDYKPQLLLTFPPVLNPLEDAYIYSSSPNSNYGDETLLKAVNHTNEFQSMLKFDISNIDNIKTAKLRLYCYYLYSGPTNLYVNSYTNDWNEHSITFANAESMGDNLTKNYLTTAGKYYDIDVSDYVKDAIGSDLISFSLSSSLSHGVPFYSKEGTYPPQLVLNEPLEALNVADAYVYNGSGADTNYGDATVLVIKKSTGTTGDRRSFIKFDLSGQPAINNAKLRMYCTGLWNGEMDATIYNCDGDWTEDTITYNTMPDLGTELASNQIDAANTYYEWDVTDEVQSRADSEEVNFAMYSTTANYGLTFASWEASSHPPQLIVNAASPITLTTSADSYIQSGYPQDNFSTLTYTIIKLDSSGSTDRRTYLKFDLDSISTVSQARLRIYCQDLWSSTGQVELAIHEVSNSWTESGITYENAPALGDIINYGFADEDGGTWVEVDVTNWVKEQLDEEDVSFGIYSNSTIGVLLTSKEAGNGNVATLTITP